MKYFVACCLALFVSGCFSANVEQRRYYVVQLPNSTPAAKPLFPGLVRVRDLDAETAYDKFQIVIRHSPYELSYRESDVWAVKPNRMVSDAIARNLVERGLFSSVTRELGERRPDYLIGGDLHAIEIYDSEGKWYAHLNLIFTLSRFDDGEVIGSYSYEQRQLLRDRTFAEAIRGMSALLDEAFEQFIASLPKPTEQ